MNIFAGHFILFLYLLGPFGSSNDPTLIWMTDQEACMHQAEIITNIIGGGEQYKPIIIEGWLDENHRTNYIHSFSDVKGAFWKVECTQPVWEGPVISDSPMEYIVRLQEKM